MIFEFDFSSDSKGKHSPEYVAAIASPHWKNLIQIALHRSNASCEHCRRSPFDSMIPIHLSLHHLTYERLGKELESDVVLLCEACHENADKKREQETRRRQSARLYHARFHGWASKKYGDDYGDYYDESMHEEFQNFLERQD